MSSDIQFTSCKWYRSGTTAFTTGLVGAVQRCGGNVADIAKRPSKSDKTKKTKKTTIQMSEGFLLDEHKYIVPVCAPI